MILITISLLVRLHGCVAVNEQKAPQLSTQPVKKVQSEPSCTYEVSMPQQWRRYISVGEFTLIGSPFWGVRGSRFSADGPLIRFRWSVQNLTAEPLYLEVGYNSMLIATGMQNGYSVGYFLDPNERREIRDHFKLISTRAPVILRLRLGKLQTQTSRMQNTSGRQALVTPPLSLPSVHGAGGEWAREPERDTGLKLKEVRLRYSEAQGNVLELEVGNRRTVERNLGVFVAANDPQRAEPEVKGEVFVAGSRGSFAEARITIKPNSDSTIRMPYTVPVHAARNPHLAFRVFESRESVPDTVKRSLGLGKNELRYIIRDVDLVCWGSLDLREAAEKGHAKLPSFIPLEERVKLTVEKRSEHFLFRYRPNSYAQRNIDTAIKEREGAYEYLSKVLQMELPQTITIDFYPDMEAKALGSGTPWTPANTVTNTHIAEVYGEGYQCDPFHELAHVFSYHFPGHGGSGGEGLNENFADYFEGSTKATLPALKSGLEQKLRKGNLRSLDKILLQDTTRVEADSLVLIDFLLKEQVESFKRFYVSVRRARNVEDLERACQNVYGTDLTDLERQWHSFLATGKGASEMPTGE